MPFKSKKQEDYLRINEPEVYKRWKKRYDNGGVNLNTTEKGITATVQDGPTWAQINKPFNPKGDASILVEQELNVTDDGRVSLKAWDTEGASGAGAELTFQKENVSFTAGRDNKENYVGVEGRIPFNKGGMNGCPMDGAVIKGGTNNKEARYTHGKRKV